MAVRRWRTSSALWGRLKPVVRQMRRNPTPAEAALWSRLSGAKLGGWSFRRQHPMGRYVVDFYCAQGRLVVEVDGPVHAYAVRRDAEQDRALVALGCTVLRFSNDEVLQDPDAVLRKIRLHMETHRDAVQR
jgi:very-short-patch-repair endonuclease